MEGMGIISFGLPNMMGRTIVGVDAMGGASPANLINQWAAAPATMGGTFGEDAHRQSISEMAPHSHQEQWYSNGSPSSGRGIQGSASNQGGDTPAVQTTLPLEEMEMAVD